MAKLGLLEISQSQLKTTPIVDGRLIVCSDTGNAYKDCDGKRIKVGNDLEIVSELPLAPISEKIYYVKPDKLYIYTGGNWIFLNDTNFSILVNSNAANGDVQFTLDGSKKSSVNIIGDGSTTVTTNNSGKVIVRTPDPNKVLELITNSDIDKIFSM